MRYRIESAVLLAFFAVCALLCIAFVLYKRKQRKYAVKQDLCPCDEIKSVIPDKFDDEDRRLLIFNFDELLFARDMGYVPMVNIRSPPKRTA